MFRQSTTFLRAPAPMISTRALIAIAVGLSWNSPALAQQGTNEPAEDAQTVEEIVVTSRRLAEQLIDVPIAISAVSSEKISEYNFKDFTELQDVTPGFRLSEISFRGARQTFNYVFRGLFIDSFLTQAPATLFIDGAPVLFGRLASFDGAERVEVLKGPQAVYFGRSTYTGAINIVTKTPSDSWAGRLSGEVGQYGSNDVGISVEGPLVEDKLAVRLSARNQVKGGQYTEKVNNMEVGGRDTLSFSGTLYATPTDNLKIKLFAEYSEFHDSMSEAWGFPTAEFGNCNPAGPSGPRWICGGVPDVSIADNRLGFPAVFDQFFKRNAGPLSVHEEIIMDAGDHLYLDNISTHATLDYEFASGLAIGAIAAYHASDSQAIEESTQDTKDGFLPCLIPAGCGRAFGQYLFLVDGAGDDKSIEARITSPQDARLRWSVGASYVEFSRKSSSEGEINFVAIQQFSGPSQNSGKTPAIFGGVYLDATPNITVSAEMRYQEDKLTFLPNYRLTPDQVITANFTSTSPRISIDYKPNGDSTVYASWATGTRPGTINTGLFSLNPLVIDIISGLGASLNVDEEEIDQFEIGLKGRYLDGRLQTTIAAYFGSLTNQQIGNTVFVQTPGFTNTIGFIANGGKTDIHGLEVEGSAAITARLVLEGNFAWNASEIRSDTCSQCVRVGLPLDASVGNQFQGTPEFTGGLTGTYKFPAADRPGDWYGRAEYFYIGGQYATRANLTKTDATNKLNLRVGFETEDLMIEAFVTNALDDDTPRNIRLHTDLPTFGTALKVHLADRRRWGLRAIYNF